jgi:peptidyl-prolyl cis-trans isomerase A (cyclophilin A)
MRIMRKALLVAGVGTALAALVGLSISSTGLAQTGAPAAASQPAKATPKTGAGAAAVDKAKLKDPKALTEKAPATFKVKFATSAGDFVVQVTRDWSPNGADRFYNLVKNGYYDDCRFFRVISGFMAQFGINGDPALNTAWREATIPDDPVKQSNARGFVTFAKTGAPNSRTTQLFINFADRNKMLDSQGFSPFGKITTGMEVVDKLYSGYGEGAPSGQGPDQGKAQMEGNAYITKDFPKLDYIKTARIVS